MSAASCATSFLRSEAAPGGVQRKARSEGISSLPTGKCQFNTGTSGYCLLKRNQAALINEYMPKKIRPAATIANKYTP